MKTHSSLGRAVVFICCGLLATTVLSQNKETDQKIDPSKTKTSHSEGKDSQTDETKFFNEKGDPVKTEKTTVTPEGKVKETEVYRPNNITVKTTEKTDNSGKEVQTNRETYKDGVLVAGTITGPHIWKEFNPETGKFENWKPVAPFSNVPGAALPWSGLTGEEAGEKPKEKPKEKPQEKQAETGTTNPKIGGQLDVPYEHKFKESGEGETGKTTGMGPNVKPTINQLVSRGTIKMEVTGTGETVGHIADAKIENVSAEAVGFYFPPAVVESKSGKNQDYVAPRGQDVALRAGQTKTVPVNGICIERDKPAEPKEAKGDLVLNDGGPAIADYHPRFSPTQVGRLLSAVAAIYDAVDRMAKSGEFKKFPYDDKEEQKEIALQWCTWSSPRVAEVTGGHPATKDDMKKVAKKQQHHSVSHKTEEKIDKGIDTIWDKVELTTAKAKDLEEPAQKTEAATKSS